MANTAVVAALTADDSERGRVHALQDNSVPHYGTLLRIHGPFLFGSTDKLRDLDREVAGSGRDIEHAITITDELPYVELARYLGVHRDRVEATLATVRYVDGVNFARRARVPTGTAATRRHRPRHVPVRSGRGAAERSGAADSGP